MKMQLKAGHETELCHMILGKFCQRSFTDVFANVDVALSDCCAQQRTYEKFFGLLAQRFCQINKEYVEPFQNIFVSTYSTVHRYEIDGLFILDVIMSLLFPPGLRLESCETLASFSPTSSLRIPSVGVSWSASI